MTGALIWTVCSIATSAPFPLTKMVVPAEVVAVAAVAAAVARGHHNQGLTRTTVVLLRLTRSSLFPRGPILQPWL